MNGPISGPPTFILFQPTRVRARARTSDTGESVIERVPAIRYHQLVVLGRPVERRIVHERRARKLTIRHKVVEMQEILVGALFAAVAQYQVEQSVTVLRAFYETLHVVVYV